MRKRPLEKEGSSIEPPKKKTISVISVQTVEVKPGEILTDISGHKWKLGKAIGQGGFGEIFLVSDNINEDVNSDAEYVAKIESHQNGPLFVEINCYLRMGKENMIEEWKNEKGLNRLGVPHYVASGSHIIKGIRYRFLILPRFDRDLEEILVAKRNKLNLKTVLTIGSQIIDILEYIHSKGIVHSDIKASNILLQNKKKIGVKTQKRMNNYIATNLRSFRSRKMPVFYHPKCCKNLRPKEPKKYAELSDSETEELEVIEATSSADQVYLLDYGLASRFIRESGHRMYGRDERNAHAGTILFCSVDAHLGSPARRSDLECLGYNIVYWLTGYLPWIDDIDDPVLVEKKKKRCLIDLKIFLNLCFKQCPRFIFDYFKYLGQLQFDQTPDYTYLRTLFKNAIKDYGYKDNSILDFDNLEGWGRKQKKTKRTSENFKVTTQIRQKFKRMPLQSNLPIKPSLRKAIKDKKNKLNWSKILLDDPEVILKQAKNRERKLTDSAELNAIQDIDVNKLNPTYHMLNVYNRYMEKLCNSNGCSPRSTCDSLIENLDGYTAPMMDILNRLRDRSDIETEEVTIPIKKKKKKSKAIILISPRKTRSTRTDQKPGKYRLKG